jgi:hypothetical protein
VRELEREDVQDVALRMIELDLDRPIRVVRDDPRDVSLLRRREAARAADALDRRLEVFLAGMISVTISSAEASEYYQVHQSLRICLQNL